MTAALLGLVPGVFVSACTYYFLRRNEQERHEITHQANLKRNSLERAWRDAHEALEERNGILQKKVARISSKGLSYPEFTCEHKKINAECEAGKQAIRDCIPELEKARTYHDRTVGLRTAGLVALAATSFFLSLRFAPPLVTASNNLYRAYTICSAGSILAGLIWPPYNYYTL